MHNNTVIPTTTQRTISSTTQIVHKSIISTSMRSAEIEKIVPGKPSQIITVDDEDENETSTASFLSEISFVSLVVLSSLKVIL